RGLPACSTEACGLSRTAYRHLWEHHRDGQYYPAFGLPAIALAGLKELAELRHAGLDAHGWLVLAVGLVIASLSAFVAIGGLLRILERLLGLAVRRLPGIYRRGIARGRGDRMARLRSGRRSHKQDQLNSNGIPRFLDFFSRGTGSSNPSPSSGESGANSTPLLRQPACASRLSAVRRHQRGGAPQTSGCGATGRCRAG